MKELWAEIRCLGMPTYSHEGHVNVGLRSQATGQNPADGRALDDRPGKNATIGRFTEALPRWFRRGSRIGLQHRLQIDRLGDPFAISKDVGLESHAIGRIAAASGLRDGC